MPVNCPKCGSDRVQSFEAVYAGGTSTSFSRSRGSHDIVGYVDTHSESSTAQASLCAPPKKIQTFRGGLGIPVLGLTLGAILVAVGVGEVMLAVVVFGSIGFGIWFIQWGLRFNRTKYPSMVAAWQRKWLCQACHNQFEV